jgi:hypothetical protein
MFELFIGSFLRCTIMVLVAGLTSSLLQSPTRTSLCVRTTGDYVQSSARFGVISAVSIKAADVRDVMPCDLVDDVRYFRGT